MKRDESGRLRWSPGPEDTPDAARPTAREYANRLTAAISDDGDDLMCARWATPAYRFQFIASQELIRLSVEPAQRGSREPESTEQAAAAVGQLLLSVVNDGTRMLNSCDLEAEKTPYGYCVRVRCRDLTAWHGQFEAREQIQNRWFLYLVVHTDGVSFVLDVKPMVSANVVGPGGHALQRWFFPPRGLPYQPGPTSQPAPDPEQVRRREQFIREELNRKLRESREQR